MVTYNRAKELELILDKVKSYHWNFFDFIIIDNCSSDDTPIVLDRFKTLMNLIVVRTQSNLGHGAGIALAIELLIIRPIPPKYIIFLEDDSVPSELLIPFLIKLIESSNYSMLAPLGSINKIGRRIIVEPTNNSIQEVDFAVFDGAILKFEVISKVGLPVKDWFMMVDDYEYCYRIKKAGFKIGVFENHLHKILHLGDGSGFTKSSLWRGYYTERNYVLFVRRHFTMINLADFLIFFIKRVTACLLAPDRIQRIGLKFKGLWHGLLNKRGMTLDPQTIRFIS